MSEYKKADLITKINSDFADNDQGAITAQSLRTNFAHVLDSIVPIMASGTDVYFKSNVDIRDNSVSSASSVIGGINAQWNDNDVASIKFLTGSDTTNKDDGGIAFYTSASGVSSSTGGAGVVKKMEIANTGKVSIYGSGVSDATLQVRSIHGSGLGLLFSGSERNIAAQNGWRVVREFVDQGISLPKGKDQRPKFDEMSKGVKEGDFDLIMTWSVDRLGRSLRHLITFLDQLHLRNVDLFLHKQGINTTTPAGKILFQMLDVFAEFERSMIQERVNTGLIRARAEGKQLGRPRVPAVVENKIRELRSTGKGIRRIANDLGVGVSTIMRVLGKTKPT